MGDFVLIGVALAILLAAVWTTLIRSERVGRLESLPTQVDGSMVDMHLTIGREPMPYDDALVHVGFSGAAYMAVNEMSSREALQVAIWLEAGCESSNEWFGWAGGCGVSSVYEKGAFVVQLAFNDGNRTLVAPLDTSHAHLIAAWLRLAAAPGRTLADARRRMTKAPA